MKPTDRQVEALSGLFVDCGFTLAERKAFLAKRFRRQIAFLDELEFWQASKAIGELIEIKEGRREREDVVGG